MSLPIADEIDLMASNTGFGHWVGSSVVIVYSYLNDRIYQNKTMASTAIAIPKPIRTCSSFVMVELPRVGYEIMWMDGGRFDGREVVDI
jgi:hypothetical protein